MRADSIKRPLSAHTGQLGWLLGTRKRTFVRLRSLRRVLIQCFVLPLGLATAGHFRDMAVKFGLPPIIADGFFKVQLR